MKIVRIIARLNVGGPARHVIWLTRAISNEAGQTLLIAGSVPEGEEDMDYFARENGVTPYYIPEMSRELSPGDLISLFKVYRKLLAERPDIVHTHTAKAGTVGRVAAFLYRWLTWSTLWGHPRKLKIVHTFHGHVFHSYYGKAKTSLFLAIERMLARVATDKIVVISDQQLNEINLKYRVGRADQFEVIPLGIDLESYRLAADERDAVRSELAADGRFVIGFVGRLTEIKDIPLLLRAAAECRESPEIRFVLAGDGHLRAGLEEMARDLGIEDRVIFTGNRPDIARIYAGIDAVALTSLNEGTPLSLIEAMAANRPVIATSVGGVPGLIGGTLEGHEGFEICERGLLIRSRDPGDLAKGLIYLAKNERLRKEVADRGTEFVRTNYGRDRLVSDVSELYRKLLA